jgi:hypothetical protein
MRKHKMNLHSIRLKACFVSVVVVFATSTSSPAGHVSSAETTKPSCTAPEYRQFDFWVGDWDVFEIGSPTKVARARVDRILDGCALHEDYEGTNGSKGESFSIYDASRKVWHQSWVSNRGALVVIEGNIQAGAMVLRGADHTPGGGEKQVRGTWKPVNGGVRETAVTSADGGKTWTLWFDLMFRSQTP